MILREYHAAGVLDCPDWLPEATVLLARMGSFAYGAAVDASDVDIHGVAVPPRAMVFPHITGEIEGFGTPVPRFVQWDQHHVMPLAAGAPQLDFRITGIARFCHLALRNDPHFLELLYAPERCVLRESPVAAHLRASRQLFLSKNNLDALLPSVENWLRKLRRQADGQGRRTTREAVQHGWDTKDGMHLVRLCLLARMVLQEHDMELDRHSALLQEIRAGAWSIETLEAWAKSALVELAALREASSLRETADEATIRQVLHECLEIAHGLAPSWIREPDIIRDPEPATGARTGAQVLMDTAFRTI